MRRLTGLDLLLASALLIPFALASCGKKDQPKETTATNTTEKEGAKEEAGEGDERPVPKDRPGILRALDEALAQARQDLAAKNLDVIHKSADRLGKLAAALARAGGGEGSLAKLATDLDAQGDAGNAAGVSDVLARIAKDIEAARK